MYLCVGAVCDLLSAESAGGCAESLLFLPESVRVGCVLLRFLYTGGVQNRILSDYFADISASGDFGTDEGRMAAEDLPCWGNRCFWGVFCISSERNVCSGRKASALFELDI